MKKTAIAYHIYAYKDYKTMVLEQFRLLITSGLYNACSKLYIGIVIPTPFNPSIAKELKEWALHFWSYGGTDIKKVEIIVYPDNKEEARTLEWVKNYSISNPDSYIFYFHTKGITRLNEATEDWRRYMQYFTIEKWQKCVEKLDEGFDTCGVLFERNTNLGNEYPHYSGGFWWANTNYIKTLNHSYLKLKWRYYREFWIGSNPKGKHFELHNSKLNSRNSLRTYHGHYKIKYPRVMYEDLKDVKTLCFVNHYYNPKPKKGEFIGGSTTRSEAREKIVKKVISTLKEIPGCDVKVCGMKGFSVVDIDHDFTGIHPTLIPYESLNLMREFVDAYDYFINIEDDILLKEDVLKNVIAFDKESELNELFLPNRIETKDEKPFFVDLEAITGWQEGKEKVFNNMLLKVANTHHSGVMVVSTKKFKAMTKALDPNYRETFFGGPMASAFAYFHSPFTLYRNAGFTDFHSVEHLDHWVNKDVSNRYLFDKDKYTVIIPTMWFHIDKLNQMLKKYEDCKFIEQILLINNLGSPKVKETEKVKIIGNGVNMFINPAWNMAIEKHVQTDKIVLANDDIVLQCNLNVLFGEVDKVLKEGMAIGSAFSNFPSFKQTPEKTIKIQKGPEVITRGSGQFIFMCTESYHKIPERLPIWHGDMIQFEVNDYYVFSGVPILTKTRGTTMKIMSRDDAKERILEEREFYLQYRDNGYKMGPETKESANVVLVLRSGGGYTLKDVFLLSKHIHKQAKDVNVKVYCLTDLVQEETLLDKVLLLPVSKDWGGWWAKMHLFSPKYEYLRPFLYIDLDTCLVKPFSLVLPAFQDQSKFITLEDFFKRGRLASGVMWIPAKNEKVKTIWQKWIENPLKSMQIHRGDQNFIEAVVKADVFWQQIKKGIVSFKANKRMKLHIEVNDTLICFHGKPKIWDVQRRIKWVDNYISETV